MKSTILNSLKMLTLTTALTGVIMASTAHAAITTAPVDDNISVQQVSEGQLFAAVKSDRDGTPDDGDDENDSGNGHDNGDDGEDNDGHDNDDGKDGSDDGDANDDGDDSDGSDSDSDGDGEGDDSDGDGDD